MRSRRGIAALAAAGLLAAIVIGCGGDDGDGNGEAVSPNNYVEAVCTGLSDLVDTVQAGQDELQQALGGPVSSPEEGRDALGGFLGAAAGAAADARAAVEGAGVPDVDGGDEVAELINTAVADMQSTFEQAREDAEDISVDSPDAFAADAAQIATAVRESSTAIQESLEAVEENEELQRAAEDAEACQQL